ncbi:MAG TPA: crotonase/enoyl-CoA hydratase family protein [Acidimicrobiia bacterium]
MKVNTDTIGSIRIVEIDRPEVRNAVDAETASLLHGAFVEFDEDESVDVAVLAGAGGNFCSGADLDVLPYEVNRRVQVDGPSPLGPSRLSLSKPVIAAVEGFAVAGGLELAVWCDLRVAAESAVFGVFCRRFGVPLIDGGTVRLPRLIGQSRALEMILTGRGVGAREAEEMGLANRVVADGQARRVAIDLATEIASHPPICMRNDRASALAQWALSEETAMAHELELGLQTIGSGEPVVGAERFRAGAGRHGEPV